MAGTVHTLGEVPTLSAKFVHPGGQGTAMFPFSPPLSSNQAASPQDSYRQGQPQQQQPLTRSSCPASDKSFDIRHSETFYGDLPATQPQGLAQAYATVDLREFGGQPAPAPAPPRPPQLPEGYMQPPRLQGVPMQAAKGVFLPKQEDGFQTAMDAKLKAKELQFQLKLELKSLEREGRKLAAEEGKLQKKLRAQADKGGSGESQMLARSIVQTRKAVARLEKLRIAMHQVILQLTESIAAMSMRNALKLSGEVVQQMGAFARVPELEAAVQHMRREAASCIRVDGCIDQALRDQSIEEASAAEVQKLLDEVALERQLALSAASPPDESTMSAATVPRTVPRTQLAPPMVPITRLPSTASTILPSGWLAA